VVRIINKNKYHDPDLEWEKEIIWKNGTIIKNKMKGYWNFRPMIADKSDMLIFCLAIEEIVPCNIIGMEFFGAMATAHVSASLSNHKIGCIAWRKQPDKTGKQFYGVEKYKPNYIIDDVFTTGKSITPIIEHEWENDIEAILVMINRSYKRDFHGIPIREIC